MGRPDSTAAPIPVASEREHEELGADPPPPYAAEIPPGNTGVTDDGRIEIDLDSRLTKTLIQLVPKESSKEPELSRRYTSDRSWTIRLNVVIQVVGSRGDVQPFIALGKELQKYHRVRIATHNTFETFVKESGLEFYPIGGDPKELMAYMVKNPGLIPSMKSLRDGEIQRKRQMIATMLDGCWKSCIEPDMTTKQPFVADAIIANPPSFAHVHCAQALSIPLHLMFTMPWSSTRQFPHPLASFKGGEITTSIINYASYGIVEFLTWQGLADVINKFRHTLDLEEVPASEGPVLASTLRIPFTYCWSPALVPKPIDWPAHIDVCGFFFRDPPEYRPTTDIEDFLKRGPPPVYIGFGSIVIDDPVLMTNNVLDAVHALKIRAVISRGWSGLGHDSNDKTDNVLFIDDCPHEWLFQHVAAVVHHGGAGTAACGLRNACPTVIVPFFGDQPFWGNMVAIAGAGPSPIPHKLLTSKNLTEAISFCLTPQAKSAAQSLASQMVNESGVQAAVLSFHANLPLETMQCDLIRTSVASWVYKKDSIRLSKLAAQVLIENAVIAPSDLESYGTNPFVIKNNRWDPITGTGQAGFAIVGEMGSAAKNMIIDPFTELKRANSDKGVSNEDGTSASNANGLVVAGRMAGSVAKGFGRFNLGLFKGTVVDLPLATAEGFRNVPKMYGETVKDHGEVTGVISGFEIGAKNFAHGIVDGFSDPFKQTYQGGKKEGAIGYAKGFGKGMAGFITKTSAATVGIIAYPGDGISKSIRQLAKSATRKKIRAQKLAECEWLSGSAAMDKAVDTFAIIQAFESARKGKGKA